MSTATANEREIIEIALRETSPAHAAEFEPITRGPLFAFLALMPLCALAAIRLLCERIQRVGQPQK
jgi:hypothetical protein